MIEDDFLFKQSGTKLIYLNLNVLTDINLINQMA